MPQTEREKLIEEFDLIWKKKPIAFYENLATFIIEDRKRIVEPLLIKNNKGFPRMTSNGQLNKLWDAVEETLKLAGVE